MPKQVCETCLLSPKCLYARIFEARLPDDHPHAETLSKQTPIHDTPITIPPRHTDSITLEFVTPLRILAHNHLVTHLSFPVFFESLAHRLSLLTEIYGDPDKLPSLNDLAGLADQITTAKANLRWHDWDRYSGRQKTRMKFGGLVGSIRFEGELGPFLPYLEVGAQINVGQLTTFGLGRHKDALQNNLSNFSRM